MHLILDALLEIVKVAEVVIGASLGTFFKVVKVLAKAVAVVVVKVVIVFITMEFILSRVSTVSKVMCHEDEPTYLTHLVLFLSCRV